MKVSNMSRLDPPGRVVVDLETVPDRDALALLPKRPGELSKWCLQRISAASVLSASVENGRWSEFKLRSWHHNTMSEEDMLDRLAVALAPVEAGIAQLITYGGSRHDAEILRRRAAHYLRHDLTALTCIRELGPDRHRDVLKLVMGPNGDRPPSLREVCAGLGIDTDHTRSSANLPSAPEFVRKSQVDVAATFVADLHERALESGNATIVLQGWDALAAYLRQRTRERSHLAGFWTHPLVLAGLKDRKGA